jgi:hypothetical protein
VNPSAKRRVARESFAGGVRTRSALAVVHANVRVGVKLGRVVGVVGGIDAHGVAVRDTGKRLHGSSVLVEKYNVKWPDLTIQVSLKQVLVFLLVVVRIGWRELETK